MKLNKEDLMIGDWVMIKDYPIISEPKRMTENHFVRSLCEFEAIPITVKFLRDNGFEYYSMGDMCFYDLKTEQCFLRYSDWYKELQIWKARFGEIDPKTRNCIRRNDRYDIKCERFRIDYVHELQHIFRLCKIKHDFIL